MVISLQAQGISHSGRGRLRAFDPPPLRLVEHEPPLLDDFFDDIDAQMIGYEPVRGIFQDHGIPLLADLEASNPIVAVDGAMSAAKLIIVLKRMPSAGFPQDGQ